MTVAEPLLSAQAGDDVGRVMHDLVVELFPLCRSLTGEGLRRTLRRIAEIVEAHVARAARGQLGICESCAGSIPPSRLRARGHGR